MDDIRDKKFETLFDGDEIDGKVYPIEAVVTGIDLPTAVYLQETGRIAAVGDERAGILEKRLKAREAEAKAKAKGEKLVEKLDPAAAAKTVAESEDSGNQTPPPPPTGANASGN